MSLPDCFGVYWEGIQSNDDCNVNCGAKNDCLARFATDTLVKYQRKLGATATVAQLAEATGVVEEAICVALDFQKNKGMVFSSSVSEPISQPVSDGLEKPNSEGMVSAQEDVKQVAPRRRKSVEKAASDESAPKKRGRPKGSTSKTPTGRSRGRPKKKQTKAEDTSANFRTAGAALRVAAPAKRQMVKSAIPVEEQERKREWSKKHNKARFDRERKRSPLIRQLPAGYVVLRRYPYEKGTGPIHRVVVRKGHYTYRSRRYPTLYAVMKAITGTRAYKKQYRPDGSRPRGTRELTVTSAVKFFGLAKLILTLAEEKAGKGRSKKLPKQSRGNRPRRKRASSK